MWCDPRESYVAQPFRAATAYASAALQGCHSIRSAALQGCAQRPGRPEVLRYETPPYRPCDTGGRLDTQTCGTLIPFRVLTARGRMLSGLVAVASERFNATDGDRQEQSPGARVSASFRDVLGVTTALGRTFSVAEDTPGAPAVAIIGRRHWTRRFGLAREPRRSGPCRPGAPGRCRTSGRIAESWSFWPSV